MGNEGRLGVGPEEPIHAPTDKELFLVTCRGESQGQAWKHTISTHDNELDAVVAASGYRNLFHRTFGPSRPLMRRWVVERMPLAGRREEVPPLITADDDELNL